MLKQPSKIDKKAKRYFLKNTGENKYELDEDKIKHSRHASMASKPLLPTPRTPLRLPECFIKHL